MLFSEVSSKFMKMEATTKRLELTSILGSLLEDAGDDLKELVYLIQGNNKIWHVNHLRNSQVSGYTAQYIGLFPGKSIL